MRRPTILILVPWLLLQACGGCPKDDPGLDFDGDGFGVLRQVCADEGVPLLGLADCNDDDPATYPGADEYCNGFDDDCDGEFDEHGAVDGEMAWFDEDRDGYGAGDAIVVCSLQIGLVRKDGDCDDDDGSVNPEGEDDDHCDGQDRDCDGALEGRVWLEGAGGFETVAEAFIAGPEEASLALCDGTYDLVSYGGVLDVTGVCEGEVCSELRSSSVELTGSRIALSDVRIEPIADALGLRVVSGDVSIDHVVFDGHKGGALDLELMSGAGVIQHSSFLSSQSERGGALSVHLGEDVQLLVRDTTFMDNHASADGGAVWVAADSAGSLRMLNVNLVSNEAVGNGGAIAFAEGSSTALSLEQSSATESRAGGDGGVLWSDGTVSMERFTATKSASGGQGGVAYLAGSSVLRSVVIEDSEAVSGGGLWLAGTVEGKLVRIATSAANEGGGMYVAVDAEVELSSLALDGNTAVERGGGGVVAGSLTSAGCIVSNNSAAFGGGLMVLGSLATEECVLDGNEASVDGGALYVVGTAAMQGVIARFNTAQTGAGAHVSGVLRCSDGANDGIFAENEAKESGGAVFLSGVSQLRSVSCSYDDNSAPVGSALAFGDKSEVLFTSRNDTFDSNRLAPAFEGLEGSVVDLRLQQSRFFDHAKGVFKLGPGYKLDCVGCNWSDGAHPNAYSVMLPTGTTYSWTFLADVVCDDAVCED
ncbi:MAG: hypothetical protein ACI9MC_001393 [Kiritimatiellia bacterium]|jgi:hypothetical protein